MSPRKPKPPAQPAPPKPKPKRTAMCIHRVPPEAFCKRGCDG